MCVYSLSEIISFLMAASARCPSPGYRKWNCRPAAYTLCRQAFLASSAGDFLTTFICSSWIINRSHWQPRFLSPSLSLQKRRTTRIIGRTKMGKTGGGGWGWGLSAATQDGAHITFSSFFLLSKLLVGQMAVCPKGRDVSALSPSLSLSFSLSLFHSF